jgi:hypothetical protein
MFDHSTGNTTPGKPNAGCLASEGTFALTATEECNLWRQRAFENLAAMERYLTKCYGSDKIPRWL